MAGVRRAVPRRIHGVRLAITATARSDGRIAVRGRGWALTPVAPRPIPRAGVAIDRQYLPGAGLASQLDAAAVLEARAGADNQITHGAGDQDLAGAGLAADPRGDVHRESPDVGVQQFALAGVDASTDLDAQPLGLGAQRLGAADAVGPSKVVRWPSPVLLTTVPPNRFVRSAVISPKSCSTARHRWSPAAAACAVEATMSVNNTVRRARCDCAGAGWLPVRNSSVRVRTLSGSVNVGIGEPRQVVYAVDLEVPRARDVVGEVAATLHRNDGVLAGMDDQGRGGDRRQDRPHVEPKRRFE
jgi:hypothetical protein